MIESAVLEEPSGGERLDDELLGEVRHVEDELARVRGVANAADARTVELMADLLRSGGWRQAGICSPAHYLVWKCGVSRGDAERMVRVARRIGTWPTVAAAFAGGELSLEQANIIASCSPPGWADAATCRFAKLMTTRQLRHVLANYRFTEPGSPEAEAEEAARGQVAGERRRVSFGPTGDGHWKLHAELPVDEGAAVEQALTACRDDLFRERSADAGEDPHSPPGGGACGDRPSICWADALVEISERALAHGAQNRPHHDRYRVLWHHTAAPDGRAVLRAHQGEQTAEWMRRFLTCDAMVTPVLHAAAGDAQGRQAQPLLAAVVGGAPVNVGRTQRIVPDRVRRLIEHRDGGCCIPGCDRRHWLMIHHIVHWENGGATDTHNLVAICSAHHRQIHQGVLHVSGDADQPGGLTITDEGGRQLTGAASAAPPHAPPTRGAEQLGLRLGSWRHPLGERLRYDDVYFNRPSLN